MKSPIRIKRKRKIPSRKTGIPRKKAMIKEMPESLMTQHPMMAAARKAAKPRKRVGIRLIMGLMERMKASPKKTVPRKMMQIKLTKRTGIPKVKEMPEAKAKKPLTMRQKRKTPPISRMMAA